MRFGSTLCSWRSSDALGLRFSSSSGGPCESREPSNKGMKLSKPGFLGGSRPIRPGIIESGFAAYAQCYAYRGAQEDILTGTRTGASP
jgi:hypothetical protein